MRSGGSWPPPRPRHWECAGCVSRRWLLHLSLTAWPSPLSHVFTNGRDIGIPRTQLKLNCQWWPSLATATPCFTFFFSPSHQRSEIVLNEYGSFSVIASIGLMCKYFLSFNTGWTAWWFCFYLFACFCKCVFVDVLVSETVGEMNYLFLLAR